VVRSDIEEGLSLSQTASIELLKKLITKNLIIKTGSGKKTEYRAVEDI
jgi:predicted transcriptional regulator